ncbi:TetR/AcrR family transcriptional regulator [Actinomadura physcomitrii]|uniref:TetR/AcrR family transcriptional regulator n=1 Tax=Actinomadura physcomitrii TaxID=2650748 RepID=UPI001370D160|nr:TetR/AcrR family transcriptional regulator [Actinomadura physcomitrii]
MPSGSSNTSATTPRRRAGRPTSAASKERGDGRTLVTAAAREAFAEYGYHGVSIRAIAKAADVSMSAMYHYYPGKQELLFALLQDGIADYHRICRAALDVAGDDPVAHLDALVGATVRYRATHKVESNLMLSEVRNLNEDFQAQLREPQDAATTTMTEIISAGIRSGQFTTKYPDDARRAVFAMCNSVAHWYDPSGPISLDELVTRYWELAHALVGYREQAD